MNLIKLFTSKGLKTYNDMLNLAQEHEIFIYKIDDDVFYTMDKQDITKKEFIKLTNVIINMNHFIEEVILNTKYIKLFRSLKNRMEWVIRWPMKRKW